MIEVRDLVLVGREEVVTEDTRPIHMLLDPWKRRARRAWLQRWPDKAERWDQWNVMACIGSFGRWSHFDFLTYEGLGEAWMPELVDRIRYTPLVECADPIEVSPVNPPVLLRTTRLLSEPERKPHVHYAYDRLLTTEKRLAKHGLLDHPLCVTKEGFARLCRYMGLVVETEEGSRQISIREVTDADLRIAL
jgi:hypothetical protein